MVIGEFLRWGRSGQAIRRSIPRRRRAKPVADWPSVAIIAGAPADQAGGAAAIEETSYEIGGVLGVAVLGSLAAAVYRSGLPAGAPAPARDFLAGALSMSLGADAITSYEHSFAVFGLAGGLLMLAT